MNTTELTDPRSCCLPVARRGFLSRTGVGILVALAGCILIPALKAEEPKAGIPGPVPDGIYTMMKISGGSLIGLGKLEIRGATYQAGSEGGFQPFTIDGAGNVTWSAGIRILPDGWKVERSIHTKDGKGRPLIKIHYMTARGSRDVIDALKEK